MNNRTVTLGRFIFGWWGLIAFIGFMLTGIIGRQNPVAGMGWAFLMVVSGTVAAMMVLVPLRSEAVADTARLIAGAWSALCAAGAALVYLAFPVHYYSQMFSKPHLLGFVIGLAVTALFCFKNVSNLRIPSVQEMRDAREARRNEYDSTKVDHGFNERVFARRNENCEYIEDTSDDTIILSLDDIRSYRPASSQDETLAPTRRLDY